MPTGSQPTLLLTRPEEDSLRLAASFPGWPVIISPVLRIVPVDHDRSVLERAQGLVFTSAHAVGPAGPGRGRPALCVGGRTAQAAHEAGYAVMQGNGFAESLLPLIAASPVPLLHPQGQHVAHRLPVPGVVVYDQLPQPLTATAQALLAEKAPVVVPVFSPRSARLLSAQAGQAQAPLWLAAISEAARAAWNAPCAREIVAAEPSVQAMHRAIAQIAEAEQS
ncbi:uroporphyrinogen-III synthase [Paracoccus sp. (in: a-proteobacteria)]|uniref:uroporphyrinogen-III synthase n=1 Tax=Paracoccus sp. TaxID=267 RepID=UPI00396C630F